MCSRAFRRRLPRPFRLESNHQIQVLSSPFFRNQTAYIVGRVVNGVHAYPFVVPIKHDAAGKLYFDALIMDDADLAILFSANRAYFLVDMEVPSAYVDFLRAILPDKTAAELYTMVGLQKAGKNFFFRDFLHHLRHSRDKFIIAPGIKGLVMTVFTLPSYPYVFKVIRDKIAASKDTDRQKVKQKYWLVKHHDRVGRMTDILEYSDVAFPRARFSDELIAELVAVAPSVLEFERDHVVVKHLYIERRMIPLNLYLEHADDAQRAHAMREYGDALKELAAVNIFAGDLLFKNFGVTRFGRVVFYDYDEIEYLTACNFRTIPPPPPGWDDMSDDVWYAVGPHDIFPEEFETFLLTDPRTRACFREAHADLLDARWWQDMQAEIRTGRLAEVLSYPGTRSLSAAPRRRSDRAYPALRTVIAGVDRCATAVPSHSLGTAAATAAVVLLCASCAMPPSKDELEAAKNTFACRSRRSADRDPLRRRRGPAADAGRRSGIALPDPGRLRGPLCQRRHGAARQGDGSAARPARRANPARRLPAVPGAEVGRRMRYRRTAPQCRPQRAGSRAGLGWGMRPPTNPQAAAGANSSPR